MAKNPLINVVALFALTIALFSRKPGSKAHTELEQGKTIMMKQLFT